MKITVTILICSLLLSGCAAPIEMARQNCNSYGYQQGTLEMSQCLEADVQSQFNRQQRAAAIMGATGLGILLLNK